MRFFIVIFMLLISLPLQSKEIVLVGDSYCPYYCMDFEAPGLGVEVLKEVFEPLGYTVTYRRYPWLRALRMMQYEKETQRIYVAFTLKNEGGLLSSKLSPGSLEACFFARKNSNWAWQGVASEKVSLGLVNGTDYTSVESFIEINSSHNYYLSSQKSVELLIKMLVARRIDAVLQVAPVFVNSAHKLGVWGQLRLAGCVDADYRYFLAVNRERDESEEIFAAFDAGLKKLQETGRLRELSESYGIDRWRSEVGLSLAVQ